MFDGPRLTDGQSGERARIRRAMPSRSARRVSFTGRPRVVPQGITRAGRTAGYTTALCLVLMSIAYLVASWDELMCQISTGCTRTAAAAGLVWLAALIAAALGGAIARAVHRSSVDPGGASGWAWGLAALFVVGTWTAVTRIPSLTCPVEFHLDVGFRLCIGRAGRFDATSWVWLKNLLWSISAVVGLTIIRSSRAMPWSAVIAALAWFGGMGWFLHDTLLKSVS